MTISILPFTRKKQQTQIYYYTDPNVTFGQCQHPSPGWCRQKTRTLTDLGGAYKIQLMPGSTQQSERLQIHALPIINISLMQTLVDDRYKFQIKYKMRRNF